MVTDQEKNDLFPKGSIALFLAQLFTRPRCKPWDLVKQRRYRCCRALTSGEHGWGCMTGKTIHIPKYAEITL